MVRVGLRIERAVDVQLAIEIQQVTHRLDHHRAALVPDEAADEPEAQLALRMRHLLQRVQVIGAHPVVREQEGVRIEVTGFQVHVAQEAAG